jgi:hypothetical protein
MVVRLLPLRRMIFFLRARQKTNTVKSSFKATLQCSKRFFSKISILGPKGIFLKCHFLSAPSLFLKRRRRMRGMKLSVVGDDA